MPMLKVDLAPMHVPGLLSPILLVYRCVSANQRPVRDSPDTAKGCSAAVRWICQGYAGFILANGPMAIVNWCSGSVGD
ncbi:hypothetical protein BDV25DRAFT_150213 [Aspergillus avenaceus]|uniref:Uncharacterized protein n=1 Tax=Aspergillus avenaceus TaxID=36643 RepID=A0A5N6U327_ASPAV|nr:hypothetical protein BDV25DRAFT_150213 [Aspergillus avenaceus]